MQEVHPEIRSAGSGGELVGRRVNGRREGGEREGVRERGREREREGERRTKRTKGTQGRAAQKAAAKAHPEIRIVAAVVRGERKRSNRERGWRQTEVAFGLRTENTGVRHKSTSRYTQHRREVGLTHSEEGERERKRERGEREKGETKGNRTAARDTRQTSILRYAKPVCTSHTRAHTRIHTQSESGEEGREKRETEKRRKTAAGNNSQAEDNAAAQRRKLIRRYIDRYEPHGYRGRERESVCVCVCVCVCVVCVCVCVSEGAPALLPRGRCRHPEA